MGKTKVICFANNKGGSGKSTTCANVGCGLAGLGKKVLLIDGDMQLNLSLSYFPEEKVLEFARGEKNLYYAVKDQKDLKDYIIPTPYENIDLIPSSTLMSSVEYELFTKWQREFILRKGLRETVDSGKYDYILIDSPPTLGGWVMNVLCASDALIVPVEATPWGLFGLGNMFEFLEVVRPIAPELRMTGLVVTKVDARKNYFKMCMCLTPIYGLTALWNGLRTIICLSWRTKRAAGAQKNTGRLQRRLKSAPAGFNASV